MQAVGALAVGRVSALYGRAVAADGCARVMSLAEWARDVFYRMPDMAPYLPVLAALVEVTRGLHDQIVSEMGSQERAAYEARGEN